MEQLLKEAIKASVQNFRLPTYEEIPDVGLYLEQTAQYVADRLAPLQSVSITPSMVSNYVKQGLIESPVKKLYYRDQIAYLFFIAAAKTVLSLEDIQTLIRLQKQTYDTKTAYRYFSQEFENILFFIFGLKDNLDTVGSENSDEKAMLRNTIITMAHKVYLNKSLRALQGKSLF